MPPHQPARRAVRFVDASRRADARTCARVLARRARAPPEGTIVAPLLHPLRKGSPCPPSPAAGDPPDPRRESPGGRRASARPPARRRRTGRGSPPPSTPSATRAAPSASSAPSRRSSPAEVRFLTDVDHRSHEALGALRRGRRALVGAARYVAYPDRPGVARLRLLRRRRPAGPRHRRLLARAVVARATAEGFRRPRPPRRWPTTSRRCARSAPSASATPAAAAACATSCSTSPRRPCAPPSARDTARPPRAPPRGWAGGTYACAGAAWTTPRGSAAHRPHGEQPERGARRRSPTSPRASRASRRPRRPGRPPAHPSGISPALARKS